MSQALLIDVPPAAEPDTDERYTPTALFKRLTAGVTLELDASATAESARCQRYYSLSERGEDGLRLPWDVPTWNNPPWSDIRPWIEKAHEEIRSGRCPLLYQLLPAWSDRPWWHKYVEPHRDGNGDRLITARFQRRERFGSPGDPEGLKSGKSPDFWCVLLIWRVPAPTAWLQRVPCAPRWRLPSVGRSRVHVDPHGNEARPSLPAQR